MLIPPGDRSLTGLMWVFSANFCKAITDIDLFTVRALSVTTVLLNCVTQVVVAGYLSDLRILRTRSIAYMLCSHVLLFFVIQLVLLVAIPVLYLFCTAFVKTVNYCRRQSEVDCRLSRLEWKPHEKSLEEFFRRNASCFFMDNISVKDSDRLDALMEIYALYKKDALFAEVVREFVDTTTVSCIDRAQYHVMDLYALCRLYSAKTLQDAVTVSQGMKYMDLLTIEGVSHARGKNDQEESLEYVLFLWCHLKQQFQLPVFTDQMLFKKRFEVINPQLGDIVRRVKQRCREKICDLPAWMTYLEKKYPNRFNQDQRLQAITDEMEEIHSQSRDLPDGEVIKRFNECSERHYNRKQEICREIELSSRTLYTRYSGIV